MNRAGLIRVIACFALVFVLGATTGWLLKPAAQVGARQGPSGERVLANLDARHKFTEEQKKLVAVILEEWERESAEGPRGPRRRLQLLEKYSPRIRDVLTPEQWPEYDKGVEAGREWLRRRMR